jgi:NADH:ubiquinone oxidoreductase subunit F (NADH-binding)
MMTVTLPTTLPITGESFARPDTDRRLLAGDGPADLDQHVRRFGPLPGTDGRAIRDAVAAAGLTGRGGAGFPTYRKMAAVTEAAISRRRPVVIANGAEGEPASGKDRTLLARAPHLVLDGLVLAARAVGATRAHVYVPRSVVDGVSRALAEPRCDAVPISLHVAPDAFVAGEESAVVSAIAGGPAAPTGTTVRVSERGLDGRPTLVQNVETLAHLALIARYGAGWFRRLGTEAEPGGFLATVTGPVRFPGVYEAPYSTTIGALLEAAGGVTEPIQAVLVGGYHGAWVPADHALPISRAGLARFGATPGAGVVVPLAATTCGLAASARILGYLAGQSAGQCGPCVNGLPRLADTFTALARRTRGDQLVAEVERLAAVVSRRGACKHPDGTARFIRSSLRAFAPDVAAHLAGWCLVEAGDRP